MLRTGEATDYGSTVILVPQREEKKCCDKLARLFISTRLYNIINIALGIMSIKLQIAALRIEMKNSWYTLDHVGHGIWAGVLYVIAGGVGLASEGINSRGLIITTIVFAGLSIASAIVASVLSGRSFDYVYCSNYYSDEDCRMWHSLEWTLMAFSLFAILNNIALTVFASLALCKDPEESYSRLVPSVTSQSNQNYVPGNNWIHGAAQSFQHPATNYHQ